MSPLYLHANKTIARLTLSPEIPVDLCEGFPLRGTLVKGPQQLQRTRDPRIQVSSLDLLVTLPMDEDRPLWKVTHMVPDLFVSHHGN